MLVDSSTTAAQWQRFIFKCVPGSSDSGMAFSKYGEHNSRGATGFIRLLNQLIEDHYE